jgi:hypothetical protein
MSHNIAKSNFEYLKYPGRVWNAPGLNYGQMDFGKGNVSIIVLNGSLRLIY